MLRRRLAPLVALPLALFAFAGCGGESVTTEAPTEGVWIDAGSLDYHVQASRLLGPGLVPDVSYLKGVPRGVTQPTADEAWFAVFLRIENKTDRTVPTPSHFEIEDTLGSVFKPIALNTGVNPFAYSPTKLLPGNVLPRPDTAQDLSSTAGTELLFKLPLDSYQNRPLTFRVIAADAGGPQEAQLDLDV